MVDDVAFCYVFAFLYGFNSGIAFVEWKNFDMKYA